jgi:hypothetical protein
MKDRSRFEDLVSPAHLEPRDTWAPSGETFEEAVAWARLLNITVTKPRQGAMAENFVLTAPGAIPRMIPICSPTELIDVLRRLASSTSNTFIHEAPSPAQPKVCHGRITVRR